MQVFRHVNSIFASNTYILTNRKSNSIYIVDPGSDADAVLGWLNIHNFKIEGILLTHAHHDHIYGVNDLLNIFPNSKLFVTQNMIGNLTSSKNNISAYMERPFTLNNEYTKNIEILEENCDLYLWNDLQVFILLTPGHTEDSITFQIDKYIFSGDALIPGAKIVYRKKTGGDYMTGKVSVNKIYNKFAEHHILLPGHGKECSLNDSKCINTFQSLNYHLGFYEIK